MPKPMEEALNDGTYDDYVLKKNEPESEEPEFLIKYKCPNLNCQREWEEIYSCACDSSCPDCDEGDIQASTWEEL